MAKQKPYKQKEMYNGMIYILKIEINTEVVYKIGTTNRTVLVRALEIAGELHAVLGFIPKITILRANTAMQNYQIESEILQLTAKNKYMLPYEKSWCGESELRKMNEQELLKLYDDSLIKAYPAVEMFRVLS